jgi:WD40 repeat protein
MAESEPSFPSQFLSDKNQSLRSENRRLRERLLELYVQINSLSSITTSLDLPDEKPPASARRLSQYNFIQTDSHFVPGGAIYSAAVDRRGETIALASLSGSIPLLSSELKPAAILTGHSLACRDVFWGSGGLVSCGLDQTIRIWDAEKGSCDTIPTTGLAHSVCGCDSDPNLVFAAAGDYVFWVDRRRDTPITIAAATHATAVTAHESFLAFGGYSGRLHIVDRRALQRGALATIELGGGPVSGLSRSLSSGRCVAVAAAAAPRMIELNSTECHELEIDPPGRFGCRADIADRGLMFDGDFAVVCGGKSAALIDGAAGGSSRLFESVGGFQYGGVFMTSIYQKILTYSEDGMVSVWSLQA